MDILGLEDDPDFWNFDIVNSDEESFPIKDLTKPQPCDVTFQMIWHMLTLTAVARNEAQSESTYEKPVKKRSSGVLQTLDLEPKKRLDGTYEYGHAPIDVLSSIIEALRQV
jgi:hypothetical protein